MDLEDTTGKTAYAEYDFFGVASENGKYKPSLGTYSGTCFDASSFLSAILRRSIDKSWPVLKNILKKAFNII